eukprot:7159860-Alexandrium_andersonii.AAC.1
MRCCCLGMQPQQPASLTRDRALMSFDSAPWIGLHRLNMTDAHIPEAAATAARVLMQPDTAPPEARWALALLTLALGSLRRAWAR